MSDCPQGKIRNPATGRCVKIDGAIGRKLTKTTKRAKTPKRTNIRKKREDLTVYIKKILGIMHPDLRIYKNTLMKINIMLAATADRIATFSVHFSEEDKKATVDISHVQKAINAVLPTGLARFVNSRIGLRPSLNPGFHKTASGDIEYVLPSINPTQDSLEIPVEISEKFFSYHKGDPTMSAKIAFSAVIEYLCAEITELAGNACKVDMKSTVSIQHLYDAIKTDVELDSMFSIFYG